MGVFFVFFRLFPPLTSLLFDDRKMVFIFVICYFFVFSLSFFPPPLLVVRLMYVRSSGAYDSCSGSVPVW